MEKEEKKIFHKGFIQIIYIPQKQISRHLKSRQEYKSFQQLQLRWALNFDYLLHEALSFLNSWLPVHHPCLILSFILKAGVAVSLPLLKEFMPTIIFFPDSTFCCQE